MMNIRSPKPQMKQADLTIVIPAYREERRIGKTLDELAVHIKTDPTIKGLAVEVLVVAADAPDDTDKVVLSKKKKFRNLTLLKPGPKVGKGRDVQYGMLKATGKIVIFMDADLATPLHHLAKFYKAAAKGDDIVIATRNLLKHHSNKLRRIISNVGNGLFRVAGGVWLQDVQPCCRTDMFLSFKYPWLGF
jgi:glycosyltransferase involved in cell wall biosynthesis